MRQEKIYFFLVHAVKRSQKNKESYTATSIKGININFLSVIRNLIFFSLPYLFQREFKILSWKRIFVIGLSVWCLRIDSRWVIIPKRAFLDFIFKDYSKGPLSREKSINSSLNVNF